MSSSPWARISTPEPSNLQDIMSEVAKELHLEENKNATKLSSTTNKAQKYDFSEEILVHIDGENDLVSDALVARLLQEQFDEEYIVVKHAKNSYGKTLKIPIFFNNGCEEGGQNIGAESESEENEEEVNGFYDHKDWNQSDTVKTEIAKHDIIFYNKGGAGFDVKSTSNKIENSLKLHWKQDPAIAVFNLDEYSKLQLHKMIKSQIVKRVNHVIGKGKEAIVLHAEYNSAYPGAFQSKECVLKVFTLTEIEFNKHVKQYTPGDKHFSKRVLYRRHVNLCAEKEMLNLLRLKKAGILCPEVIGLENNILTISFIGENCQSAPTLKDIFLTDEHILAYRQVVEAMKILYSKARLILTDLSECNILWHNKQCYFIDGQAVELNHDEVFCFLMTDCINVTKFFNRKKLPGVMTPEELFMEITGLDYKNKIDLEAVKKTFAVEPDLMSIAEKDGQDSVATE